MAPGDVSSASGLSPPWWPSFSGDCSRRRHVSSPSTHPLRRPCGRQDSSTTPARILYWHNKSRVHKPSTMATSILAPIPAPARLSALAVVFLRARSPLPRRRIPIPAQWGTTRLSPHHRTEPSPRVTTPPAVPTAASYIPPTAPPPQHPIHEEMISRWLQTGASGQAPWATWQA